MNSRHIKNKCIFKLNKLSIIIESLKIIVYLYYTLIYGIPRREI